VVVLMSSMAGAAPPALPLDAIEAEPPVAIDPIAFPGPTERPPNTEGRFEGGGESCGPVATPPRFEWIDPPRQYSR
jgi:hypothetical protein